MDEDKKLTKQMLLKAFVPEYFDNSLDFVVLDINADVVRGWIRKIEAVAALRAVDSNVYKIEYWNSCPTWAYGKHMSEYLGEEKYEERCEEVGDGWLVLDEPLFKDDFDPTITHEGEDHLRTECEIQSVTHDDIRWHCYRKHSGLHLETAGVSLEHLRHILEDLENVPVPPACICVKDSHTVCRWCWANDRLEYWQGLPEVNTSKDVDVGEVPEDG